MRRPAKGRTARRDAGTMNGLEKRYAGDILAIRKAAGEIADWWYESVTLKLAPDTRYTPDFMVQLADGTLEFHECKGFMEDHAAVKLKVAATLFPHKFVLVRRLTKKQGGGWDIKEVGQTGAA